MALYRYIDGRAEIFLVVVSHCEYKILHNPPITTSMTFVSWEFRDILVPNVLFSRQEICKSKRFHITYDICFSTHNTCLATTRRCHCLHRHRGSHLIFELHITYVVIYLVVLATEHTTTIICCTQIFLNFDILSCAVFW